MNDLEIARIAGAVSTLRPDWPTQSLITLLRTKLANRPRRDVAVALVWVACDSDTLTPARVLEAGPWWKATSADGSSSLRTPYDAAGVCAICSHPAPRCRAVFSQDHDFVSVARRRSVTPAPVPDAIRARLRAKEGDE